MARGVCFVRHRRTIDVYGAGEGCFRNGSALDETTTILKVNTTTIMKRIRSESLYAISLCLNAPWVRRQGDIERF